MKTITTFFAISTIAVLTAACQTMPTGNKSYATVEAKSNSKVAGKLEFIEMYEGVEIKGTISGLKPNQEHGFHIHEKGDCSSPDGLSAGGHFNPESSAHGHHSHAQHHAGDMPNLKADAQGNANFSFLMKDLKIKDTKMGIAGRSVIVHLNPDDYTSQPVGNAGGRIGCGLISAS